MRDKIGFDLWADDYDKNVTFTEENNEYPFAGYKKVLNTIYQEIHQHDFKKILDIGFGTGVLTQKLYNDGYEIYGIDFSERMIEIAKDKMPNAKLIKHDFSNGLPKEFENIKFDCIISTYAIHHITDDKKVIFLNELVNSLSENGIIIIGDVSFEKKELLEKCKNNHLNTWDYDEYYIVFNELKSKTDYNKEQLSFKQISHCAGIITLKK